MGFSDPGGLLSQSLLQDSGRLMETCRCDMIHTGGSRGVLFTCTEQREVLAITGQVHEWCGLTSGACPGPLHLADTTLLL